MPDHRQRGYWNITDRHQCSLWAYHAVLSHYLKSYNNTYDHPILSNDLAARELQTINRSFSFARLYLSFIITTSYTKTGLENTLILFVALKRLVIVLINILVSNYMSNLCYDCIVINLDVQGK